MPVVPVYDVPTEKPADPTDVRSYATAQAFGAGVGTAVAGLGKEVGQFGDVLAKHALLMQGLKNQAEADEAQVQFTVGLGELTRRQNEMEGKKRAESYPQFVEQVETLRRSIGEKFTNPEVRRAYDSNTRRQFSYSVAQEAGNAGRAQKQYNSQTNSNLVSTSLSTISADPGNDAVFEDATRNIKRAVDQEGLNRTSTPEEISFQQSEQLSAAWGTRITALADKDPEAAQKMYEDNKDKINAKDAQVIKVQINAGRHRRGSEAEAAAVGMRSDMDSDVKSILSTGVSLELPAAKVKALVGNAEYEQYVQKRRQAFKVYELTNDTATITPQQMQTRLNNIAPKAGAKDFTEQQNIYETVDDFYKKRLNVRDVDPALSVDDSPVVKDIKRNFNGDPAANPMLIEARIAAQNQAGIPPGQQAPITNDEVNRLLAPMAKMIPGQARPTIEAIVKKAKEEYGEKYYKDVIAHSVKVTTRLGQNSDDVQEVKKMLGLESGIGIPEPAPFAPSPAAAPKPTTSNAPQVWGVSPASIAVGIGNMIGNSASGEKKKEPLSKRILEGK